MNNKVLIAIIGLLLLGGVYVLISSNSNETMENDTSSVETATEGTIIIDEDSMMMEEEMEEEMEEDSMMMESEVEEFELEGSNFVFDITDITVTEGDTVRIIFNNVEGTHDWVIDEFDASTPVIQQGETAEVEFVADQAGTFEFYCSVGNHREMGMTGTLTVAPAQ